MKIIYQIFISSFALGVFFISGCNLEKKEKAMPDKYDLNKPEKFFMPSSLLEISGIAFDAGRSDTVYCIQDEDGKVFRLAWGIKKQFHSKFGKKGDYEDLAIFNNKIIVLDSDGKLYEMPKREAINEDAGEVQVLTARIPPGEYEGMYGEEGTGKLYVLCKKCDGDDDTKRVSGFILNAKDSLKEAGRFSINVSQIHPLTANAKKGFRPSALAKNPVSGEWYILSAVNKLLVCTDSSWNVTGAYPLSGNMFGQPEGIAFDKEGNLYISNEGDDLGEGNILKFIRNK